MFVGAKKYVICFLIIICSSVIISTFAKIDVSAKDSSKYICKNGGCENILFLGDSITEWYPIEEIFGDMPIVRSGIAGYETNDILKRMEPMVYRYNPTKVFLLIGTNDLKYKDDDEDEVYNNIVEIISKIRKNRPRAIIYYQTIYPVNRKLGAAEERYNDEIIKVNSKMKKYCENNNVVYIDMYSELKDDNGNFDEKFTKDGLHPNNLGYARISRVLTQYIY